MKPESARARYGNAPPPEGHLWVACWCGAAVLAVPRDLVGVTTYACGRTGCKPLPAEREPEA